MPRSREYRSGELGRNCHGDLSDGIFALDSRAHFLHSFLCQFCCVAERTPSLRLVFPTKGSRKSIDPSRSYDLLHRHYSTDAEHLIFGGT